MRLVQGLRRQDYWRRNEVWIFGDGGRRSSGRRPVAMEALGRGRQTAVCRRDDFMPARARLFPGDRKIAARIPMVDDDRLRIDDAWSHMAGPIKAPIAFRHAPGRIIAVDDHRHRRIARHDERRLMIGARRRNAKKASAQSDEGCTRSQTHECPPFASKYSRILKELRSPGRQICRVILMHWKP